jgi:hypothetical protein
MKRAYTETPEELEARVGVLVAQRTLQVLRERAWDAYAGQGIEFTVTGAFNAGFEAGALSQHVPPVCVYCQSPLNAQIGYVVTTFEGKTDGCCEPCWVRMSTTDGGDFLTQEKTPIQETPVDCTYCGGHWDHHTDSVGHKCLNDADKAREFLRSMGWTAMIRDDVIGCMIAFLHDQMPVAGRNVPESDVSQNPGQAGKRDKICPDKV